jgi:hypothetical protein
MVNFRKNSKEFILETLKKINEELKTAIETLKSDGVKAAIDDLTSDPSSKSAKSSLESALKPALEASTRALDLKQDMVTGFPGIEARPGVEIPFFAIYETFYDADRRYHTFSRPGKDGKEIAGWIEQSIKEIETNLINKYGKLYDDPNVLEILREIVAELKDLKDEIEAKGRAVGRTSRKLEELKHRFFKLFQAPLDLWVVYLDCETIDIWLENGLAVLLELNLTSPRKDDIKDVIDEVRTNLERAEKRKKALERLVGDTPSVD